MNNIDDLEKTKCTGCTACSSVCPKNCIKMQPNYEGFLYPEVEKSKCIGCGLCKNVCQINLHPMTETIKHAYIANDIDKETSCESTSGRNLSSFSEHDY